MKYRTCHLNWIAKGLLTLLIIIFGFPFIANEVGALAQSATGNFITIFGIRFFVGDSNSHPHPNTQNQVSKPKVIEFGWDIPNTRFVKNNIIRMENQPFDGVVLTAQYDQNDTLDWIAFSNTHLNNAVISNAIQDLQSTNFVKFTDNFLRLNVNPVDKPLYVGWFDEKGWSNILNNVALAAHIAKEGGLKGIFLDTESYGYPMFHYSDQDHNIMGQTTFEEYQAQARLRGKQFIDTISAIYPDITLIIPLSYSYVYERIAGGNCTELVCDYYGLLPYFLDGILANAPPGTTIIDGYEPSYGFKSLQQYANAYQDIKVNSQELTEFPSQYQSMIKAGFGIWLDYKWKTYGWNIVGNLSQNYFSPQAFLSAIRNASAYSESYVWIYSQNPNWWGVPNWWIWKGAVPGQYIQAFRNR
jgi:hypothetical protein